MRNTTRQFVMRDVVKDNTTEMSYFWLGGLIMVEIASLLFGWRMR